MPRYEFKDAKSHKFWEIKREGDSFTTRFGKFGTDGQTSTKTYDSDDKCSKEYEKVIKSKTKKGYVLVGESLDAAPAASGEPRNADLERAIYADPTNEAAWQVYGDWLQTEGDPRGELIAIDVALAQGGADKKALEKRKAEIFEANEKSWLSDRIRKALEASKEADGETLTITWKHGFIDTVRTGIEYDYEGPQPVEVLRDVFKSSSARFLRELRVGLTDAEGENSYDDEILAISKAGKLEALEHLFLGDFEFPDETEISWTEVGDVSKMLPVLRAIKHLEVQGGGIEFSSKIDSSTLETLILRTGGLPSAAAKAVSNANLPNLKKLEVWFGTDDYGGDADVSMIKGVFNGAGLPKVEHLGLKNSTFENDIAKEIAGSKILAQLETLDLSMGTMTDEGAAALVEHAAAFKHLKSLDLSDNFISDAVVEQLKEAFGEIVTTGNQEEGDDWGDGQLHYYVSVGE